MTEVKIVMDDYGLLYAILPDGSKRVILADIFGNTYYGVVRVAEETMDELYKNFGISMDEKEVLQQ